MNSGSAGPKQDLVGRRVEEVIGAAAYQKLGPYIERAFSGETVTYQGEVPYLDDQTRFIEATYVPQIGEDKRVVGLVALISDVSERKAFERFRADAAARAERLVKITAAVADAVTTDEVLDAVVDNVAAAVDASSAALWLVEEDSRTAKLARAVGYKESASQGLNHLSLDAERVSTRDRCDSPRRADLDPLAGGAAPRLPAPRLGGHSGALLPHFLSPVGVAGPHAGCAGPHDRRARRGNQDERDFLLLVARYAGQAIERLRLLDAERKSRAEADAAASRLALLNQASRAFGDADLDLEARLRGVAAELATPWTAPSMSR